MHCGECTPLRRRASPTSYVSRPCHTERERCPVECYHEGEAEAEGEGEGVTDLVGSATPYQRRQVVGEHVLYGITVTPHLARVRVWARMRA